MSNIGMLIIVAYSSLGFAISIVCAHFLRNSIWRWPILVVLFLGTAGAAIAPWLEEQRIAAQFEVACRDSGTHVVRKASAPGYFDDIGVKFLQEGPLTNADLVDELNRTGFQFVEYRGYGKRNEIYLVERSDGGWVVRVTQAPRARYHYKETKVHEPVGHRVFVYERSIIDSTTGEEIAREATYRRLANSLDQAWMGVFGSTSMGCPRMLSVKQLNLLSILAPKK